MANKKRGILEIFSEKSLPELYTYVIVCIGCVAAMVGNLAAQQVGLAAFSTGSAQERELLILTIAVVTGCALAAAGLLRAAAIRREKDKRTRISTQKKLK